MKKLLLIYFFIFNSAFADYVINNTVNGCVDDIIGADSDNNANMTAVFTPNEYVCEPGFFVPANVDGCRACPQNRNCPGGVFSFNEKESHGIEFGFLFTNSQTNSCVKDIIAIDNNNSSDMFAVFTINQHNCSAGYYLPANIDECTKCSLNHYCSGGTYTFNETTDQGIIECPTGTFAPAGSSGCYAHILHVGNENIYLRSTKLTTPSLNVAYGDNVYYANATITPTPITAGSEQYLKVMFNDVEYYICDDTSYNQ